MNPQPAVPAVTFDTSQLIWQLPLLIIVGGALLLLLLEAFARTNGNRRWLTGASLAVMLVALVANFWLWGRLEGGAVETFAGMIAADRFSLFMTMTLVFGTMLVTLLASDYMREHDSGYGEFHALLLFALAGMMILVMASDLVTVFLGIETMSIAAYVLTGSFYRSKRSSEAAMKYFVTGAFATGILLFGMALVYGATGETNLVAIGRATAVHGAPLFLIGVFLLVVAFGFKIAAVPFHMWAPDAYEGAPTPVSGFMAAGIKAAAFAGLLRLFVTAFGGSQLPFGKTGWASIFAILAVATMTVGNIAALRQENVKRLLAYSSISHAGYLLIGVIAAGITTGHTAQAARSATLFYLLAYTFTTVGAFGVVAWIGRRGDERLFVDDWAGVATRHPGAALAMTIFLVSLGGIPPTAGFFGKFYVFRAAMQANDQLIWLVVIAIVNSVISIYYYLRIVMAMYFREPAREPTPLRSPAIAAALVIAAVVVLAMGILPGPWLRLADASAMFGVAP